MRPSRKKRSYEREDKAVRKGDGEGNSAHLERSLLGVEGHSGGGGQGLGET